MQDDKHQVIDIVKIKITGVVQRGVHRVVICAIILFANIKLYMYTTILCSYIRTYVPLIGVVAGFGCHAVFSHNETLIA